MPKIFFSATKTFEMHSLLFKNEENSSETEYFNY